jgi:hypothetical protein
MALAYLATSCWISKMSIGPKVIGLPAADAADCCAGGMVTVRLLKRQPSDVFT